MSIGSEDCKDWCEGRQDDPRSKISPGLKPLRQETQDLTLSCRYSMNDAIYFKIFAIWIQRWYNYLQIILYYMITLYLYTRYSIHTLK